MQYKRDKRQINYETQHICNVSILNTKYDDYVTNTLNLIEISLNTLRKNLSEIHWKCNIKSIKKYKKFINLGKDFTLDERELEQTNSRAGNMEQVAESIKQVFVDIGRNEKYQLIQETFYDPFCNKMFVEMNPIFNGKNKEI